MKNVFAGAAYRSHPIGKFLRKNLGIYLFLLPGTVLFVTWTIYPIIFSFIRSFQSWDILNAANNKWIGVGNYIRFVSDPHITKAFLNVLCFTAVTVMGKTVFGLLFAVLLNQKIRALTFWRTVYFLPVAVSMLAGTYMFRFIFSSQEAGLINYILVDILRISKEPVMWFQYRWLSLIGLTGLNLWKGIGFGMVIYLAALQTIPIELDEACTIDGAMGWKKFRYLTLPLIQPTILFTTVMYTMGGMNAFLEMFVLTPPRGEHIFDSVLSIVYQKTFGDLDFGIGTSSAFVMAVILGLINFMQVKAMQRSDLASS